MTYQYKTVGLSTLAAVAISAAFALAPTKADAATLNATEITVRNDLFDASSLRGTTDDRDNANNAIDGDVTTFFELGYGGIVDFRFGDPSGEAFFGPGAVIEITGMSTITWPEAVRIEVGMQGSDDDFVIAEPNPFTNADAAAGVKFTFSGGPFDTVRLIDVTLDEYPGSMSTQGETGGFDVAAISVTPVPLPASALLLLGGLGGLGGLSALRRRKRTA